MSSFSPPLRDSPSHPFSRRLPDEPRLWPRCHATFPFCRELGLRDPADRFLRRSSARLGTTQHNSGGSQRSLMGPAGATPGVVHTPLAKPPPSSRSRRRRRGGGHEKRHPDYFNFFLGLQQRGEAKGWSRGSAAAEGGRCRRGALPTRGVADEGRSEDGAALTGAATSGRTSACGSWSHAGGGARSTSGRSACHSWSWRRGP